MMSLFSKKLYTQTYRVEEKYATASVYYQILTNLAVTLHNKVAFGKKVPFSLNHGLLRMHLTITIFFKIQKVSQPFSGLKDCCQNLKYMVSYSPNPCLQFAPKAKVQKVLSME